MASLGYIGYQLYFLPQGLLVVGPEVAEHLFKKSKEDIKDILDKYLEESGEEDVYFDHKINRSMLM